MNKTDGYSVKREITNALMELMTKKSYMDITVTDVVNEAQVARASFYRNFNSISDVIDEIVKNMTEDYVEDLFPILSSNDERKWRELLFEHFYRFIRKQRKMSEIHFQNASVIFSRIDNKMREIEETNTSNSMKDKYLAIGKLGLVNSITKKWVDSGMKETPEEMINYIMSFIIKF